MAASWQGGSYTKICLAAAVAGSVGLALYLGFRKRPKPADDSKPQDEKGQTDTKSERATSSADIGEGGVTISETQQIVDKPQEESDGDKSLADTSLTESSFSILGDDDQEAERKEPEAVTTKDDNDIVVIEDETIVVEPSSLIHSSPPQQPESLSAFELSSLEPESSGTNVEAADTQQLQSLSTYDFPSLEPDKTKNDNGSDIEVLSNNEDKTAAQGTKEEEKSAKEAAKTSHIPVPSKDSRKSESDESKKDSVDSKDKHVEDSAAQSAGAKAKEQSAEAKPDEKKEKEDSKPPPVPPKPKIKPEAMSAKFHEVHMKHPTSPGEFLSFGMRLGQTDAPRNHVVIDVEDGGPAHEAGLRNDDIIIKVNDMNVTHWSRAVLLEQFRMIPTDSFDLTVRRSDQLKYMSVHITEERDGVAVSGVTIDINNVPKSNDISLEFADGPDAVLKCNLVSSAETFAQISDEGLCLKESTAEGNSFVFEKVTFKEKGGEGVVVVLRGTHDGSTVFITVLNRKTVGVQVHTDIFSTVGVDEDVTKLRTADSRCFYLNKSRSGAFWLESTQFPDHYLCAKDGQFSLLSLTQASEVTTNRNIRFSFKTV